MVWPFGRHRGRFGDLRVVRILHDGDKSVVYLAEAPGSSHGTLAVKLYKREYDRLARSLERKYGVPSEGEVGMRLNPKTPAQVDGHPIVITKRHGREFGKRNGRRYIVLEFVEGVSLKTLITCRDPRVWARRAAFLVECCLILRIIHEAGSVCRDFCSQNLIVRPDGHLKLVDLGFVAPAGLICAERSGTPGYMSPEQVSASELTPASDIYSLGVVLYEMLTGRLPYVSAIAGDDAISLQKRRQEVMQKHLDEPVPEVPGEIMRRSPRLSAIAAKCLQKASADRFATVDELIAALKRRG